MKYRFTSISELIATLEKMAIVTDNKSATELDQNFRSFYSGQSAGFRAVIQFLAVSTIDELEN